MGKALTSATFLNLFWRVSMHNICAWIREAVVSQSATMSDVRRPAPAALLTQWPDSDLVARMTRLIKCG